MDYKNFPEETWTLVRDLHATLEDFSIYVKKVYGRNGVCECDFTVFHFTDVAGEDRYSIRGRTGEGIALPNMDAIFYRNGHVAIEPHDHRSLELVNGAVRQWLKDTRWQKLVDEALQIRRAIVRAGQMATKSLVEDILLLYHQEIDRGAAHDVIHHIEARNLT